MVKKTHVTHVALTVVGVMLAGFAMYRFREVSFVGQARAGYDM